MRMWNDWKPWHKHSPRQFRHDPYGSVHQRDSGARVSVLQIMILHFARLRRAMHWRHHLGFCLCILHRLSWIVDWMILECPRNRVFLLAVRRIASVCSVTAWSFFPVHGLLHWAWLDRHVQSTMPMKKGLFCKIRSRFSTSNSCSRRFWPFPSKIRTTVQSAAIPVLWAESADINFLEKI